MRPTAVLVAHLSLATLSVTLFGVRCALSVADLDWRRSGALRILPHVVDTALLGSGVWLMLLTRQYPFVTAWLSMKLLAVVAYIALGYIALRRANTPRLRSLAAVAALSCVAWIVLVAHARHPFGPFAVPH